MSNWGRAWTRLIKNVLLSIVELQECAKRLEQGGFSYQGAIPGG